MPLFAMQIRGPCADVHVCTPPSPLPLHPSRLVCVCVWRRAHVSTSMYVCVWGEGHFSVSVASMVISVSGHSHHRGKVVLMGSFPLLWISPLHECCACARARAPQSCAKQRWNPLVLQMFQHVWEVSDPAGTVEGVQSPQRSFASRLLDSILADLQPTADAERKTTFWLIILSFLAVWEPGNGLSTLWFVLTRAREHQRSLCGRNYCSP